MLSRNKKLRVSAADAADQLRPRVADARAKAGPALADARAKAGPALADARAKAEPVLRDAGERARTEGSRVAQEVRKQAGPTIAEARKRVQPALDEARHAATPYVEGARKQVEPALDEARRRVEPALDEARKRVQPALEEARAKAAPLAEEARRRAEELYDERVLPVAATALSAADEATSELRHEAGRRSTAAVAALKGEVEPPKEGGSTGRKVLFALGMAGVAGLVAKKLGDRQAAQAWESAYTPNPPKPAGGAHRADDIGGGNPGEAVADGAETPHAASTPDDPADVVDVEDRQV